MICDITKSSAANPEPVIQRAHVMWKQQAPFFLVNLHELELQSNQPVGASHHLLRVLSQRGRYVRLVPRVDVFMTFDILSQFPSVFSFFSPTR